MSADRKMLYTRKDACYALIADRQNADKHLQLIHNQGNAGREV